jgi:Flp pilus assembly pilin Flp
MWSSEGRTQHLGTPLQDPKANERIPVMIEYLKTWLELKIDKRAVTALEYGLIAAAIIAVVSTVFFSIGGQLKTTMEGVNTSLGG